MVEATPMAQSPPSRASSYPVPDLPNSLLERDGGRLAGAVGAGDGQRLAELGGDGLHQ